ncbi:hypothetical protein ACCC98_10360 [Rhizobium pisi]|uniref:hypothetical protein n=1 Tax=Rhizobium pisi TaxID=574561 RepID=UPI0039AFB70F
MGFDVAMPALAVAESAFHHWRTVEQGMREGMDSFRNGPDFFQGNKGLASTR